MHGNSRREAKRPQLNDTAQFRIRLMWGIGRCQIWLQLKNIEGLLKVRMSYSELGLNQGNKLSRRITCSRHCLAVINSVEIPDLDLTSTSSEIGNSTLRK